MSRFTKLFGSTSSRHLTARKARLGIESLEARDVPSTSLVNEVLTVRGTAGADTIEILSPQSNQMIVRVNGVEEFAGSNTIRRILIDGRDGSDTLSIRGLQSGISEGTRVINSETVTVGELNPVNQKFSLTNVRSELLVENAFQLNLNNTADTAGQQIAITSNSVEGLAPVRIGYSFDNSAASLIVRAGTGSDTYTANGTANAFSSLRGGGGVDTFNVNQTRGAVQVIGGGAADIINVAPASHSLASIGGRLTVTDGSFLDKVNISDENAGATAVSMDAYIVNLTADRLTRTEVEHVNLGGTIVPTADSDTIVYDKVGSVRFAGATRFAPGSQIALQASNAQTSTTIDPGAALLVKLGSAGNTLDAIDGLVTVTGGLPSTRLLFNDAGQTPGQRYTLRADSVSRLGMATVSTGSFLGAVIDIAGGSKNDTFDVVSPRADGRAYSVDGNGGGRDLLIAPTGDNFWQISGQNQGRLNESILFADVDSLTGKSGADTFHFNNGAGVSGKIDGAGGFDTLDYQSFATPVTVNLGTGTATNVGLGIARMRNVFGGFAGDTITGDSGNNVLLGNAGIDSINGGTGGRDLLVGGFGSDILTTAGTGDTIYIGANLAAGDQNDVFSVRLIMNEWTSTRSYDARVANLQNGTGANAFVKLNAQVLENDAVTDAYTPRGGQDLFFVDAQDTFAAGNLPADNEQVISV